MVCAIFFTVSCKNQHSTKTLETTKKSDVKIAQQHKVTHPNCLLKSDSLIVKQLVSDLIQDINLDREDNFSSKIDYPLTMFTYNFKTKDDFITQWNKTETLKGYLSLDIYDEDDEFKGKSNASNTKIIFFNSEENNTCFKAQFGIGSGLIFTLNKVDGKLKIVHFDTAG